MKTQEKAKYMLKHNFRVTRITNILARLKNKEITTIKASNVINKMFTQFKVRIEKINYQINVQGIR